jgi:hypothetical protein
MTESIEHLSMRVARQRYFQENGFGEDGGYQKKVVWVEMGPLRLPVPNSPSRVYAVRYHDMHHVLTGYATDWRGEFEISAWEIGAGCADAWFAWGINLGGLMGGLLTIPRRTAKAFYRGRRSCSLYAYEHDAIIDAPVAALRARTNVASSSSPPTARDRIALVAWALLGLAPVGITLGALAAGLTRWAGL